MNDPVDDATISLLRAAQFAARAHHGQIRKDKQTPYASHPFRVCLIVRHVFGIDDAHALTAALLHDTIEDTTTDFDDLEERFGAEIATSVAALSKDSRIQHDSREAAYMAGLAAADWRVKVCKLADMLDNMIDSEHLEAKGRHRTVRKLRGYLDAIKSNLPEQAVRPASIVEAYLNKLASQS